MAKYKVEQEFEVTEDGHALNGTHSIGEEVELEEEVATPFVEDGSLTKVVEE